uniref:Uncharacterized protein n=1 Tax=Anguilla anguilla TaxID=7936 RepID=A0A0E9RTW0_ANGAN
MIYGNSLKVFMELNLVLYLCGKKNIDTQHKSFLSFCHAVVYL